MNNTNLSNVHYRLGLVQVNDIIGENIILPLAIGTLWAQHKLHPWILKKWQLSKILHLNNFSRTDIEELAKCDMVCFSTYIWNVEYHVKIATEIKKINPNCYIVAGGPNYDSKDNTFWNTHRAIFNLIILGEGEHVFIDLLKQFPDQHHIHQIAGAWPADAAAPKAAERISDTEVLVSPYLTGFYNEIVKNTHKSGHCLQAVIQTNRGCPYHCTFCEEGSDYHNKIHTINLDRIMKEIEWCGINQVEYLSIPDDNFGILSRDIQIMEKLCQTKIKYGYPKILDTTWAKNNTKNILEIVKIDKKYQTDLIRSITVAVQSENKKTLAAIKRFNLDNNKKENFIRQLKKHNVPCYAEVIWPLPFETYNSLCDGFDNILEQGADNWIGMYPLVLLPSASLYHDFKDYYQFSPTDPTQPNVGNRGYQSTFSPNASEWANRESVVDGHVFYMWLTALYFFGFARPAIDFLKQNLGWSVSKSIKHLIQYLDNTDNPVSIQHSKLKSFYNNWLTHKDTDELNQFRGHNVDFWYPFTHHATWLQLNDDTWNNTLRAWLLTCVPLDAEKLTELCNHSTVKFNYKYPYINNDIKIELNHTQPQFNNVYEFCRFYYWWRRKNGFSRTQISQI